MSNHHPLIDFLERHADNRAMLAALRRGLGQAAGEVPNMFPFVIPFIQNSYEEADLYLIASLFALHPISAKEGNFGSHLRILAGINQDDSATTRRFVQLLRLRRESLATPLRQHVSLLRAKEIAVNWDQLLKDLRSWNHSAHYIQKRWASAYWTPVKKT